MALAEQTIVRLQEFFSAGRYAQAADLLTTMLATTAEGDPERADLLKILGRISYYEGDIGRARKYFQDSVAANASDPYALFYLAHCLDLSGDKQSAIRAYAETLNRVPSREGVVDHLAAAVQAVPFGDASVEALLTGRPVTLPVKDPEGPLVSVIVLCHNKMEFTVRCLTALFAHTDYPRLEVFVVDNASVDDTPGYLEMFSRRVNFLHSPTNLGFVGGNNFAAQYAKGDLLVFLNNDSEVRHGWLTEMLRCMAEHPDAGVVGARLVYPDGTTQEAGGIIFSDGNGWNYGREYTVKNSRISFLREVDYCSGAALMVRRDLFTALDGFDSRYAPAYCEDSDLCFGVRELGYKVYYCPSASVLHHEGATAGTDVTTGFKRFQEVNRPKFRDKWSHRLQSQYPNRPELVWQASRRGKRRSVLIIDDWPPLPDKASGTLRMYSTTKEMLRLGWSVTYAHLVGTKLGPTADTYFKEMSGLGVEFIWLEYEKWWALRNSEDVRPILRQKISTLELGTRKPDVVYLSFWFVADFFIDLIRQELPDTPIIIDTHDLHYVRELRQAEVLRDKKLLRDAQGNKRRELAAYAKADAVTTVTENDRQFLMNDLPGKPVFIMTNIHEAEPGGRRFEERRDLLFVGNFNHTPNTDAVRYFADQIFPKLRIALPGVKLFVVGNNPPEPVRQLACDDIVVTGWVPSVRPYFEQCRISVVPIRYGAGVKGKVGEAMAHGLPSVLTTVAAEGMNIVDGEHGLIADDPEQFAGAVTRLYGSEELWQRLAAGGVQLVSRTYSAEATRRRLDYIMSFETRAAFQSYRALRYPTPPRVSIIIITFNQWEYTRQCLESIRQRTSVSHEILIIDNGSTDPTLQELARFPEARVIRNGENRGFPAAVNQGFLEAKGDDVVLLNNDAVVTEGWLEELLRVAESDRRIGIVGPMSNRISGAQSDAAATYTTIDEMHRYAARMAEERKNETLVVPRVAFFCTLIRRAVLDAVGSVDERFSPGNYEDDDFCLRANIAGFTSVIARGTFVHHYGSKSFLADGVASYKRRLEHNLDIFARKWGGTPEELFTRRKPLLPRQVKIPLSGTLFERSYEAMREAIAEGSTARALACVEEAVAHFHDGDGMGVVVSYDNLLLMAGTIALTAGDLEKAEKWYQQTLALTPRSLKAFVGLARVYEATGQSADARRMCGEALALDADHEPAHDLLRRLPVEPAGTGRADGLERRLETARTLFSDGKFAEAINAVDSLEDLASPDGEAGLSDEMVAAIENFRGVCLLSLQRPEEARTRFEHALHVNPQSSRACAGLGEVMFLSGQHDGSKTMFEWAMHLDPESAAAREGLARANLELGYPVEHNTLQQELQSVVHS
jgi:GT2 family glycosyltransferase/glycosyltransferase involved in cell wall biosynthesis/Flp pilus assembly protein TadD